MNSADTLLRLDNILVLRGMIPIFRDLSLCVSKGQIMRIHGANGSGKSTLLRVCAGLKKIEKGYRYLAVSPCWLGQSNGLKSSLTLRENLSFPPADQPQNIEKILSRLELRLLADKTISSFSSGQKRRAAFAKMLLKKSPLWLLDEPETGLDRRSVHILEDEINIHTQKGGAVLIATHLQKEDLSKNESIFFLKSREE